MATNTIFSHLHSSQAAFPLSVPSRTCHIIPSPLSSIYCPRRGRKPLNITSPEPFASTAHPVDRPGPVIFFIFSKFNYSHSSPCGVEAFMRAVSVRFSWQTASLAAVSLPKFCPFRGQNPGGRLPFASLLPLGSSSGLTFLVPAVLPHKNNKRKIHEKLIRQTLGSTHSTRQQGIRTSFIS